MSNSSFERIIDSKLDRIKDSLPSVFSSADFIKVVKDCFPLEYATILQQSNYRTLHIWIARWYLNRHFKQQNVTATPRNKKSNKLWKK